MKHNQKGFSAVEVVIMLVIIGLIGATGWYVWQQRNKNTATPTQNTSSINPNSQIDDQSDSIKYLTLTDFKARIPLNDKTSGLQLGSVSTSGHNEADKNVEIIAPELDDSWTCEAVDGVKGSIGSISVTTQKKRSGPGEPAVAKTIGDYTFGFEPGGANCTDSPQYQQLVDAFKVQFDQIQAY